MGGTSLRTFLFFVLHSAFCICFTGCNVIGAIAAKVGPPPTIPAQYALAKKPTVVIVENFRNPASLRLEADAVALHVYEELKAHDVVPLVGDDAIDDLRQRKGAAYRTMPLDAIAREVGAAQVIYVDLERFELVQDVGSEAPGGTAEAHVRVVDAETGDALWPLDSAAGQPLTVSIDPRRITPEAPDAAVRRLLHQALADRVAKLFYNWQGDSLDEASKQFE
jgi:hypothetical protein